MESNNESVRDVVKRYVTFCNKGNFESWIALWDSEGRQMPPGAPSHVGVDEIRKAIRPLFESMNLKLDLISIDDVLVFGDIGITRCTYSMMGTPKEGGDTITLEPDSKSLTVLQKKSDGSRKIEYDCFNSNVSPGLT